MPIMLRFTRGPYAGINLTHTTVAGTRLAPAYTAPVVSTKKKRASYVDRKEFGLPRVTMTEVELFLIRSSYGKPGSRRLKTFTRDRLTDVPGKLKKRRVRVTEKELEELNKYRSDNGERLVERKQGTKHAARLLAAREAASERYEEHLRAKELEARLRTLSVR